MPDLEAPSNFCFLRISAFDISGHNFSLLQKTSIISSLVGIFHRRNRKLNFRRFTSSYHCSHFPVWAFSCKWRQLSEYHFEAGKMSWWWRTCLPSFLFSHSFLHIRLFFRSYATVLAIHYSSAFPLTEGGLSIGGSPPCIQLISVSPSKILIFTLLPICRTVAGNEISVWQTKTFLAPLK